MPVFESWSAEQEANSYLCAVQPQICWWSVVYGALMGLGRSSNSFKISVHWNVRKHRDCNPGRLVEKSAGYHCPVPSTRLKIAKYAKTNNKINTSRMLYADILMSCSEKNRFCREKSFLGGLHHFCEDLGPRWNLFQRLFYRKLQTWTVTTPIPCQGFSMSIKKLRGFMATINWDFNYGFGVIKGAALEQQLSPQLHYCTDAGQPSIKVPM